MSQWDIIAQKYMLNVYGLSICCLLKEKVSCNTTTLTKCMHYSARSKSLCSLSASLSLFGVDVFGGCGSLLTSSSGLGCSEAGGPGSQLFGILQEVSVNAWS